MRHGTKKEGDYNLYSSLFILQQDYDEDFRGAIYNLYSSLFILQLVII